MPRLVARDLAVTPPGAARPAVEGFSIELSPGEWVAIGGANGGGKTCLLLALAGLWPASAGTVLFEGEPIGPDARRSREGVAAVLQDPSSQILQSTVHEELAFAARNRGASPEEVERRVAEWATRLGLESELAVDPRTLSAGRQQLVLLGAAMAGAPTLLCADEATAHLDPAGRERVAAALRAELGRGLAVLWVTQDPVETAAADRRVWIGDPPGEEEVVVGGLRPVPAGESVIQVTISPQIPVTGPRVAVAEPLRLDLRPGEVLALEGPNGAGKSVVLAAVAGLEPSPQVEVSWRRGPDPPPIVALQYPELQIFEEVVEHEIVFAAVARGLGRSAARDAAARALTVLGFDPGAFMARRTWSLSTGEKRLVEVVAALIAPASLVLLDEPSAGLDGMRRCNLGRLIRERSKDLPILVASQDRSWVRVVADRIVRIGL